MRRRLSTRFRQAYPLPRVKPFRPYVPALRPPAGKYDPQLDAAERAANRGLGDLTMDTDRSRERMNSDYLLSRQSAIRQRDEGLADLLRQRGTVDLNYQRMGGRQAQSFNQAGVAGGAFAQAAAKRATNKTADLVPIGINETRLKESTDRRLGELATSLRRSSEDLGQTLTRAQREAKYFGLDTSAQRFFQARGLWPAPIKPANEYSRHGLVFQLQGKGPKRIYTLPSGERLTRGQYVALVRSRRGVR